MGLKAGAAAIAVGLIVLVLSAIIRGRGRGRRRGPGTQEDGIRHSRDPEPRSARSHVLNPTDVYSPSGVLDRPGDTRDPQDPDVYAVPESVGVPKAPESVRVPEAP